MFKISPMDVEDQRSATSHGFTPGVIKNSILN